MGLEPRLTSIGRTDDWGIEPPLHVISPLTLVVTVGNRRSQAPYPSFGIVTHGYFGLWKACFVWTEVQLSGAMLS